MELTSQNRFDDIDVREDEKVTRMGVSTTVIFKIRKRNSDKVIFTSQSIGSNAFNRIAEPYSNEVAKNDAISKLSISIAYDIRNQLALYSKKSNNEGKQQDISTIINDGETSLKCILLYGPNTYLINDLYNKLCDSLFDKNDVFAPSEFNIKDISKNADAFYNEAESLAFGGGRKYLKIDMDDSESAGPVLDLLKDDIKETTLLIKGGVLSPRSNIRKSLEKLENTLIVPFYEDDIVSLKKFIKEKAEKRNFSFNESAIHSIISMSGFERSQINDAVERIMLYYEFDEDKKIDEEKVEKFYSIQIRVK